MALRALVHWHEGLFLEPHHLQMMQHQMLGRFGFERHLSNPYAYGLLDCEVSQDELENMHLRFQRLRAVMPSGVLVDCPANADLPVLDIKQAFKGGDGGLTVYLGVPIWHGERANSVEKGVTDAWQVKCMYQVKEVESVDENTGENPRPVLVRKVNARLLLEGEDQADMEVLPLLRLVRSGDAIGGRPESDAAFMPPCYSLSGSPALLDMVQDLASQVEANRRELVAQLTSGGFAIETIRGIQIEQMLRLKTLNRFSARLPALSRAPGVTPFEVYLELGELMGELAALQPDRDPFDLPSYDHDNPGDVFPALCDTVRSMLRGVSAASFLKEPFVLEPEDRAMYAKLTEEDVSLANEYYLAIRTRDDPRAAAALVESADKFKVVPRSLIMKRVRGVRLQEERHPPLEFPAESGLHYFRLMRDESPKIWEQIVREKTVGITWRGVENTDFSLTLCMTVPEVSK